MYSFEDIINVFQDYLKETEYFEVLYSRVLKKYISISNCGDSVYEDFDSSDELAHHILHNFLMDIVLSEEFEPVREDEGIDITVRDAFLERISHYIKAIPELQEIAEDVIEEEGVINGQGIFLVK